MSATTERREVRRVLVAVDASPGSAAAAAAAARAAALLGAELVGLFVEDLDLLHLCSSPLAQRGDLLSASVARLERGDLEHELRAQAVRAKRSLTRAARRVGLSCTFRVTRGAVAHEIASQARESDLVSIGRYGWSVRRQETLGRTARALLERPRQRALLVERREGIHPPMVVVVDGSRVGFDALEEALALAIPGGSSLGILLLGPEPRELRRRVEERLGGKMSVAHFYDLTHRAGSEGIASVVKRLGAGLLVLPLAPGAEERLQRLLAKVECPILVVS